MSFLYYFFVVGSLFFLSFGVFADVGSVDSSYGRKAAACTNQSESADKAVSREINPANVIANLVDQVEQPRRRSRRSKSGGSSKGTR